MADIEKSTRVVYPRLRVRLIDTVPGVVGNTPPNPGVVADSPLVKFHTLEGNKNYHFRMNIRQHKNATSVMTAVKSTWSGGQGNQYVRFVPESYFKGTPYWPYMEQSLVGCIIPMSDSKQSFPGFNTSAEIQASTKFFKALKEEQTAFDGGVFLGELGQTLRMLRNPAQAIRRGLDDYLNRVKKLGRRSRGESPKSHRNRLGRTVSETWLEYVFGWSPLINDVKSAGEALNKRLDRYDASYSIITGTGTQEMSICPTTTADSEGGVCGRTWRAYHTKVRTVRWKAELRNKAHTDKSADVDLFGVSWRDLVPTAWELIPYSFLVDYFTNIGDVLSAWSTRTEDLTWWCKTVRDRYTKTSCDHRIKESTTTGHPHYEANNNPRGPLIHLSATPAIYRETTVNRTSAKPSVPTFRLWQMPGFGRKWINMTALAGARNRTRRQLFR